MLVLMRQMNLNPVIKSEARQKEKNKYSMLRHIYGIQKNDANETIFREGMEMQMQRMDLWTPCVRERVA